MGPACWIAPGCVEALVYPDDAAIADTAGRRHSLTLRFKESGERAETNLEEAPTQT